MSLYYSIIPHCNGVIAGQLNEPKCGVTQYSGGKADGIGERSRWRQLWVMNEPEKEHLFKDTLRKTPTQIWDPRGINTTILGQQQRGLQWRWLFGTLYYILRHVQVWKGFKSLSVFPSITALHRQAHYQILTGEELFLYETCQKIYNFSCQSG